MVKQRLHIDYEVTCAHCGQGREDLDNTGEHMCMGFVFDWLWQLEGRVIFEYGDMVQKMEALGII